MISWLVAFVSQKQRAAHHVDERLAGIEDTVRATESLARQEQLAADENEWRVRMEQTKIRRDLIMKSPLIRKNEDLPGTIGRKSR